MIPPRRLSRLIVPRLRPMTIPIGAMLLIPGRVQAQDGGEAAPSYRDDSSDALDVRSNAKSASAGNGGSGQAGHTTTISTGSLESGGNSGAMVLADPAQQAFDASLGNQSSSSTFTISSINEGSEIDASGGDYNSANLNTGDQSAHESTRRSTSDTSSNSSNAGQDSYGGDNNNGFIS